MSFSLDHVVIAVNDLDKALEDYSALGFNVLRGGEHPGRGSVNSLIVFQDGSYFELIAFPRPVEGFRWWELLQRSGSGFVDYALLPKNMSKDLRSARSRGLVVGDIEEGARVTPAGERVEWQTARSPTSDVPFLCGDVTPRALRVPEGDVRQHMNQIEGISGVTIAVRDLAASTGRYSALLPGCIEEMPHPVGDGLLGARFNCGGLKIELLGLESGPQGASDLKQHLERRGEGLLSVTLKSGSQLRPARFDPVLMHGARLELREH
jgi:Glyoxalase-like domain